MQTIYRLYGSVSSTTAGVAQLDIQKAGVIEAVFMDLDTTGADALNDGGVGEVSFSSSSMYNTNDVKSVLATLSVRQGFLTSGGSMTGKTIFMSGLEVPVGAGERIWMHITVSGTTTVICAAQIFVNDGSAFRPNTRAR